VATLHADGDAVALEGSARVDSISVLEPPAMRASVLGPDFFDAERDPEITFRSTAVRLADDGRAEGRRRAHDQGRHAPGHCQRSLRPTATERLRRGRGTAAPGELRPPRVGIRVQTELPGGGDAVGRDVKLDIDLLLKREDADAEG
jgi:polyisoprenoid-binding protein YceI